MSKPTIECTRVRACKWKGSSEELVRKVNEKKTKKYGFEYSDMLCPKCGCNTTYDIKQ